MVADADRKGLAAGTGRPEQYVTVRSGLEFSLYGSDPAARPQVRSALGPPQEALVPSAINRSSPLKDPLTLIRGLARALQERPDSRLLLVEDGPLQAAVQREAAARGWRTRSS